ncbi:hypothetical protein [Streptomyces sp. NPDC058623]|uniref:hypothetical protein n=1 Tax=Streptomyces sp. NPDC058623 TaxID=3346563 RepID=UPI003663FEF6
MALLMLIHVVLTAAWLSTYVYVLSRARRFFARPRVRASARPRVRRTMDRVTGTVLIGFGVRVASSAT